MNKYKIVETFFQGIVHYNNNKKKTCVYYQNEQKIALSVLHAVRNRFPETNEFIDSALTEECEKERKTVDEVINLLQV